MINKDLLGDFAYASSLEWIETNGLGGYASSSVAGANTRRYHGLLVAALQPPVNRMVIVSKLEETIIHGDATFHLSANQYPGSIFPQGFQHLVDFRKDIFPEFTYKAADIILKKTVIAVHGENTTIVTYEVISAPGPFTLQLQPFYSARTIHELAQANDYMGRAYVFDKGTFVTLNYQGCPEFFISVPGSKFEEHIDWHYNFEYLRDWERGEAFKEDLYTHGSFRLPLEQGSKIGVLISLKNPKGRQAFKLVAKETARRENLLTDQHEHPDVRRLILAADQFIVKRGKGISVIAGYHWFTDWGRDTMIALPGLCLATGRYADAKKILLEYTRYVSEGMIPNRFPDAGEDPEYNTIDATLWFFIAIYKYYTYTQDTTFIRTIISTLEDIVHYHYLGTRYGIKVDADDGLLEGGEEGWQLTWMDAKVDGYVVTPRRGKPVEVNALWYNVLCVMEYLCMKTLQDERASYYGGLARKVHLAFQQQYWDEAHGRLFDVVGRAGTSGQNRPNQIFSLSLPFPLLNGEKAVAVFANVTQHLFTPVGLRSLDARDPSFRSHYSGNRWERDTAYHQGTVWSYLLGPYIDALLFTSNGMGRGQAVQIAQTFLQHLDEAAVGSVSEVFDGSAPHHPKGAVAQAWGVAEILRVIAEHKLL